MKGLRQPMLHKLIYSLGMRIRNNKIPDNLAFLKNSEKWDMQSLHEYQLTRLREILLHAYKNTEYYRLLFDKNNIDPEAIKDLSDLKKIPALSKEQLLQNAPIIQNRIAGEKHFYSETSGSTGRPLVFFRNADWDAWHRSSALRGYSWYGVSPWERNGYLWGYNFSFKRRIKTQLLDWLQNRFRMFSYDEHDISCFLTKLEKASYLEGYSSMIYELAKRINKAGALPMKNLKMIIGTSEKIFDLYQREVMNAFGRKMTSEYGAAEAGIIAFECPFGNMHMNMETVIVEEEENEILVTNLVSHSFPIIRYRLGDYISMDYETSCECGMQHYIIKDVLGRVGKVIYGRSREYPSLTLYYVFKNLAMEHDIILNYQARQSVKSQLKLNIESLLTERERKLLIKEIDKYFHDDLDVDISDNVDLKSVQKKKVDFVSELA
jgi:phenylacetate-CoA ligase